LIQEVLSKGYDVVVNFAAESHVDRSIEDPSSFIKTNVLGVQVLLDACLKFKVKKFIQISTDEVYGSLGKTGLFTESSPLQPNSPYSASKAAADLIMRAYWKTHGFPGIITRCSNNFGPYQFPEKLIPLMLSNALAGKPLPIYGDGLNVRDWIYVEDHCRAIDVVLHHGRAGEIYNIGAEGERTNLDVVRLILKKLKRPESLITFVKDRPGHDRRYAIDWRKIRLELNWRPKFSFEEGLELTIDWYLRHQGWLEKVKNKEYLEYYERMYKGREIDHVVSKTD
jgi:dTDP-glucose 4,6-dehydratase